MRMVLIAIFLFIEFVSAESPACKCRCTDNELEVGSDEYFEVFKGLPKPGLMGISQSDILKNSTCEQGGLTPYNFGGDGSSSSGPTPAPTQPSASKTRKSNSSSNVTPPSLQEGEPASGSGGGECGGSMPCNTKRCLCISKNSAKTAISLRQCDSSTPTPTPTSTPTPQATPPGTCVCKISESDLEYRIVNLSKYDEPWQRVRCNEKCTIDCGCEVMVPPSQDLDDTIPPGVYHGKCVWMPQQQ